MWSRMWLNNRVNVIVVGGSGVYIVRRNSHIALMIRLPSCSPSWNLSTMFITLSCLHWVVEFIVTWAWSIDFFGLEMGLSTQCWVKAAAVFLDLSWRYAFVIKSSSKLVTRSWWPEFDWISTRSNLILHRLRFQWFFLVVIPGIEPCFGSFLRFKLQSEHPYTCYGMWTENNSNFLNMECENLQKS